MSPSSLKNLKDHELLNSAKALAQKERSVTMEILRHLQEISRRKLFSDLGYSSLFDYAVGELSYSEAAAGRRIQAVKLLTEIPEVAPQIESGALNLTNVCQAQGFFRDLKRAQPEQALDKQCRSV